MLGVELQQNAVVAVAVDDAGHVLARDERRCCGDAPGITALDALDAVAGALRLPLVTAGITAFEPHSPSYAGMAALVARRHPGLRLADRIVPSGTAAAVAEGWAGAAAGASDIVYFAAGAHTFAGLVTNGQPWFGAHGRAGAAAWLALNPVEREDYRKQGCLEAEVAANGIVRRLLWRVKAGDRSRIADMVNGDLGAVTVDVVLEAARAGDGIGISVLRDTAKYLGMAAANLVAATDPQVLVLGGIMATAEDLLFARVRTELARRLAPATTADLRIVAAILGSDAPAIGAAKLAPAARP